MNQSGEKCVPFWMQGYRWHCYTESALRREDLRQRVRDCMHTSPTLRHMTLFWSRCEARHPTHVIAIDLDNPSYTYDRPGNESDGSYKLGDLW